MKTAFPLKAVIFDLDGTLLDTIGDITRAVNAGLAAFGLPARTTDECRRFVGEGLQVLVRRALPEGTDDAALFGHVLEAVRREYISHPVDTTMLYPGIDLLLDRLSAMKIPMSILTNKPDELAHVCVKTLLSRWEFVSVAGSLPDRVPKPGKEAATGFAEIMGSLPVQTAVVGDSEIDILTAQNAGMFAAGVSWGLRSRKDLEALEADLIVDRPEELLQLFGR